MGLAERLLATRGEVTGHASPPDVAAGPGVVGREGASRDGLTRRVLTRLEKAAGPEGGGDEAAHAGRWALRFMKKGCTLGHPTACHTVAFMYNKGCAGVPKDRKEFERYKATTEKLIKEYGATLPQK